VLLRQALAPVDVEVAGEPADDGGDGVDLVEREVEAGGDADHAQVVQDGGQPAGEEEAEER
jgi:hypothetical protein